MSQNGVNCGAQSEKIETRDIFKMFFFGNKLTKSYKQKIIQETLISFPDLPSVTFKKIFLKYGLQYHVNFCYIAK